MQAALNRLVHDPEKTRALIAGNFAPACSSATRAMLAADARPGWPQEPRPRLRMECIANMAGCLLADIAAPAYAGYGPRPQGGGARLDLLRRIAPLPGVDGGSEEQTSQLQSLMRTSYPVFLLKK